MMILSSLVLRSYRSYRKGLFSFSSQTTIVIGPNAIGKTNLLEAIYMVATGRSFRAEREEEVIFYGEEIARASAKIRNTKYEIRNNDEKLNTGEVRDLNLEVILTKGIVQGERVPKKKFLIDGVSKRMVDFVGNLRAVLFWPQDIEIITGSPSKRRTYLDFVLTQVDREYRRALTSYEHGVRQRNRLLKLIREGEATHSQLPYWDSVLISHGSYLTTKRREFIDFVNSEKRTIDESVMEVVYDKSEISEERLKQYKDEEVQAATTLVGPHRDDFVIQVKSEELRNLHSFGSRGEQRLAVLWLKLAEVDYIEKATGERPILLLDDIFSELDHEHRGLVMEVIPKQQAIITTTDEHLIEGGKSKMEIIRLGA